MNKPNTFIIGAPKCGTTAMAHYLSEHPDIFVSHIKEPHYFIKEDMPNMTSFDEEEYFNLFKSAKDIHKVIMEASVWYLYGENSVRLIKEFNPEAKLIVMLRRPDEMVYSMHNQNYVSRDEDVEDFSIAWSLNESRKKGIKIPKYCRDKKKLAYNEIANYGSQLERVYEYFDKDNVKVVLYDDFREDVEGIYNQILIFLGLKLISPADFRVINKNKTTRNEQIANFVVNPPKFLLYLGKNIRKLFGVKKIGVRNIIRKLNYKEVDRKKLDLELKEEIIQNYSEEIKHLEQILDIDLSHWYRTNNMRKK